MRLSNAKTGPEGDTAIDIGAALWHIRHFDRREAGRTRHVAAFERNLYARHREVLIQNIAISRATRSLFG